VFNNVMFLVYFQNVLAELLKPLSEQITSIQVGLCFISVLLAYR